MNVWLLHIATASENNGQVESEASSKNISYINSDMFTPLMATLFNLAMQ